MKQIIQNLGNGVTSIIDGPTPMSKSGHVLIASLHSIISPGTERMLKSFGEANLINKAKSQPDKVKQTIDKLKTDGLITTLEAVKSKLDEPITLGYSNVGIVIESSSTDFQIGERIVSNGNHAEVVCVPSNLCAKVPEGIDSKSAAFTVIASIGLQGIRLIKPTIGESIAVFGLGLIGLISIQILRANGCRVIAIDNNTDRCAIANSMGFKTIDISQDQNIESITNHFSENKGVDGVLITAATSSNQVIHDAAQITRKRGRIVLVGDIGLNLQRDDFYKKELTFQVSSSYGPGRYDKNYEEQGNDYPIGFVRWTEQRNFKAILHLLDQGLLDFKPLISKEFNIENGLEAYEILDDPSILGMVINYPNNSSDFVSSENKTINLGFNHNDKAPLNSDVTIGFIGAGNYASRILIPAFKKCDISLDVLATRNGQTGIKIGKKFGFSSTTTDLDQIMGNKSINTVVIATQHNQHFNQVKRALEANKNIFVEKPLVLNTKDLDLLESIYSDISLKNKKQIQLMVGFNRRFSPFTIKAKELLDLIDTPKTFIMTVNAGYIDPDHWTQDLGVGGGRIVGEACHFIDLLRYLCGYKISKYYSNKMISSSSDTLSIELTFSDGSIGTIHYLSNGAKSYAKENLQIFADGKILEITNFKKMRGYGFKNFKSCRSFTQNKGNNACVSSFVNAIKENQIPPISFEEIVEVSRIAIEIQNT